MSMMGAHMYIECSIRMLCQIENTILTNLKRSLAAELPRLSLLATRWTWHAVQVRIKLILSEFGTFLVFLR
jgi:hypothetical protein